MTGVLTEQEHRQHRLRDVCIRSSGKAVTSTAESRPPCATSSVRGSRRIAARPGSGDRRPRCPAPHGLRRDHRDRGHKGPSGQGRGKRESARATSPSATLPPRRPPSPARSWTLDLREATGLPRGYSADAASGCCPATAGPCARASTPPPSAAAGAPLRARLQSARPLRSAALRREAPGHSPLPRAGGGAGRGAGAATSQPGIRPSARRQNREPPPPSRLTSGRLGAGGTAPPGERGCSLGPRTRLHGASSGKEGEEEASLSAHGRHGPSTFFTPVFINIKRQI
ncbi:unnamed protein product [Rangifer tarandus platyrhynchus]|uniref:Uncharacterized protein n=2 Tax=Rangifer tarandus platyrhynchus TaxID=3082113 RepID=A0ABN8YTM1_RANTA|nr:unnamed protein product [Rangifer tarandus platyrhynchus]CAI9702504.1 unnamed protein product [Rangifer tarandus platyrhynchus]